MSRPAQTSSMLAVTLLAINLSLGATLVWELRPPGGGEMLDGAADQQPDPATPPDPLARPDFELAPLAFYDAIVSRPLFAKTRRPPEETENSDTAAQPKKPPPTFVLVGVVIAPEEAKALLLTRNNKEIVHATVGERIEGWEVIEIQPDQVQLSRGSESIVVLLERVPIKHSNWPTVPAKPRFTPQRLRK